MYEPINRDIERVLREIGKDNADHVSGYIKLLEDTSPNSVAMPQYQKYFRKFWVMDATRADVSFRERYFKMLQEHLITEKSISDVLTNLSSIPTNRRGPKLQFVFATKLIHMGDHHAPIYDSRVSAFYAFVWPGETKRPLNERVTACVRFYDFLLREYRMVLAAGLLQDSIREFRQRFNAPQFTEEKIIDSLIWAFGARRAN